MAEETTYESGELATLPAPPPPPPPHLLPSVASVAPLPSRCDAAQQVGIIPARYESSRFPGSP